MVNGEGISLANSPLNSLPHSCQWSTLSSPSPGSELGRSALTVAACSYALLSAALKSNQQSSPGSWWAERKKSQVSTVCAFHISQ